MIIELTESALINNVQQVISNIQSLQAIGVQIAIDDFGTGFSSLAYLSSFNVDIIKINRSFIKDVPNNQVSTKITKAVVNLSKDLEIKLVAEGIENWEQLSYLSGLDCLCWSRGFYTANQSR
ncbi:MAG: EAL domain-containing protein [Alkalibacterium sp.]|nr:EAL domain-containing protein [Alkalibacterium sp.]